jgi:hypothetical protein
MSKLMLEPGRWYGWQMLPGYVAAGVDPYFSPIYVRSVAPAVSGQQGLTLNMLNAQYAAGVQDFSVDLRLLEHAADYLVAAIDSIDETAKRVAIVSRLDFEWIRRFCPGILESRPPESADRTDVSDYLNAVYGPSQ